MNGCPKGRVVWCETWADTNPALADCVDDYDRYTYRGYIDIEIPT